jgi:AcrR family transcriptional regulator
MTKARPLAPGPDTGLRARKRRETRERIADAALSLFLERGFEETTVDQIAAAADVSVRSFFHYFPAKEDVVASWQDGFGARLADAVAARPKSETLARAVEQAMLTSIAAAADPRSIAIDRLVRTTPALSARDAFKYERLERTLAEALIKRTARKSETFEARLLAMVTIGALRLGSQAWHVEHPGADIASPLGPHLHGASSTRPGRRSLLCQRHDGHSPS